jgi:hypothetical protein
LEKRLLDHNTEFLILLPDLRLGNEVYRIFPDRQLAINVKKKLKRKKAEGI